MFPAPYYAPRYYPARYWPRTATLAVDGSPLTSFAMAERIAVFRSERRGAVFERVADQAVFASKSRGAVFETLPRSVVFFAEEP